MSKLRLKVVGFGLAALAGSAMAADEGGTRGEGAPAPGQVAPAQANPANLEPGLFPPVVKFSPAAGTQNPHDPLWFPVARSDGQSATPQITASTPPPAQALKPVAQAPAIPVTAVLQLVPVEPLSIPATRPNSIQTLASPPEREVRSPIPTPANGITTVASQAMSGPVLSLAPVRSMASWLPVRVAAATWPPIGPRVGVVPPPPTEIVSVQPGALAPPLEQNLQANAVLQEQLPLPTALRGQDIPQAMPSQPLPETKRPENVTPMTPPAAYSPTLPQPRPFDAATPSATPGSPPASAPSRPLPAQSQTEQPNCDLPTAPPELMMPPGMEVPGKHGVFGSEPIRISRDYPSLSDLCGTPIRDRINAGLVEDQPLVDRGYVEAEFLLWWMRGLHVPTLATTSTSPTGTGFLGESGTVPILGPGKFLGDARDGVRLRAGMWLDDCCNWGIDGSFFVLGQRDADSAQGYSQYSVITRPVFSPNPIPGTGMILGETGEAVAVPGILNGVLTVHAQSILFGGDANLTSCLFRDCDSRATVFVGYRNIDLIESLTINENIAVVGSGGGRVVLPDPIGTMVHVQDRFATANVFNGGQIGGSYEKRWGNFDVDARASIAFGVTSQDLNISGFQSVAIPGQATQNFRGGLLAVGPNLGDFHRNPFSVAPELTLNAGYWVTPNFKIHVGYNFLYWTDVIRPGDQIDREVNLSYVPNAPAVGTSSAVRPQPLFHESDMLVHGVQFGVEYRW